MDFQAGHVLKSYIVREPLSGQGDNDNLITTYLAEQPSDNREFLIRIIAPQVASKPEFIRDFDKEAQVLTHLDHPHIVTLSDYWRDPTGAYLITPRASRSTVDAHLGAKWELDAVGRFINQIGAALAFAHGSGVLHGDVRPSNIFADDRSSFYLSGFAVARMLRSNSKSLFAWKGTNYVSPEEFWGKPATAKSDIYAFAIILYELLTGELLQGRHIYERLPDVCEKCPGVSQGVNEIIQHATSKEPDGGYDHVLDLVTDLQRILLGKPPAPLIIPVANPYPGLRSFLETDVSNFFGREALTRALLTRMENENSPGRFLAVVGPSGSGKSSVVRAGLITAIREGLLPGSEQWFISVMVPSSHPFDELEIMLNKLAGHSTTNVMDQLRRDERGLLRAVRTILPEGAQLVLVIDQFEELFTQAQNQESIQQFLDLIYAAVTQPRSPIYIVVTLRADFTDRPLLHAQFGDLMGHCTEFVTPLTPDELRQAIVRPAERLGVQVDPTLVAAIINEVVLHPGTLPMMQYALAELFDERESSRMTLDAYNRIGGTLGALTRRADDAYSHLALPEKAMTEQLFLRLVTLGEGAEDTRRRALQSELLALGGDVSAAVMSTFIQSRLLMVDRDPITHEETVELAHEAILRKWQLLRNWLDENRADVRMQRQLALSATAWLESSRDLSFLLRGTHLQQFEDWEKRTRLLLTRDERTFLDASIVERERLQAEERARQAHERSLEHTVRRFLLTLIVMLLVAAAIGISLILRVQHEARRVQALALAANAQLAVNVGNPDLAMVLAAEANKVSEAPPDAQHILNEVIDVARTTRLLEGHTDTVRTAALSPDGQLALSGSDDHTLRLWDVASGQQNARLEGHTGNVLSAIFSPDGRAALSAANNGEMFLWDVDRASPTFGQLTRQFQSAFPALLTVALSPDGQNALSGGCGRFDGPTCAEGALTLWDVATGLPLRQFRGHSGWVWSAAFSPDGAYAISGSDDHSLILWDLTRDDDPDTEANEQIIRRLNGHTDSVRSVAFSPDGRRVLSGSNDNSLILWNMAQDSPTFGQIIRRFEGHTDNVRSVAFSADGQEILSGSDDKTIIQWQMFTGQRIRTYLGHEQGVTSVVFSPSSQEALSGSIDHTLRLWSLDDARASDGTLAWVCKHRYVRALTPAEHQSYNLSDATCT